MYRYKGKIIKVIDGDTVDIEVDLGFDVSQKMRFRLYGIDTPETRGATKVEGLKAKAYVSAHLTAGKEIFINTFKDKSDKYGRYLAEIYFADPDKSVEVSLNQLLIDYGYATQYFGEKKENVLKGGEING